MPAAGLEPARGCPQQILSLPRLPFRHAGLSNTRAIIRDIFGFVNKIMNFLYNLCYNEYIHNEEK